MPTTLVATGTPGPARAAILTRVHAALLPVWLLLAFLVACSSGDDGPAPSTPTEILTGAKPWGVAVDVGRGRAYTANEGESTVSIIDLDQGLAVQAIPILPVKVGLAPVS